MQIVRGACLAVAGVLGWVGLCSAQFWDPPTVPNRNASGAEYYMLEVPEGAAMASDGYDGDWAWFDPAYELTMAGWRDETERPLPTQADLNITTRMAWKGAPDNRWYVFMAVHDDTLNTAGTSVRRWNGDMIGIQVDYQDHGRTRAGSPSYGQEWVAAAGNTTANFAYRYPESDGGPGQVAWAAYGDAPWAHASIRTDPPEAWGAESWTAQTGGTIYYEFDLALVSLLDDAGPAASQPANLDSVAGAAGRGLAFNFFCEDGDPVFENDMTVRGAEASARQYFAHALLLTTAEYTPATARLQLLTPNGGETWSAGSTQAITWTVAPEVSAVRLDYSADAGRTWTQITPGVANSGTFDWTVPTSHSRQCRIRIRDVAGAALADASDGAFAIEAPFVIPELSDTDVASLDLHDGTVQDWEALLGPPMLTLADFRSLSGVGDGAPYDPADLDARYWVGWNRSTNRLYVAMERVDDVYVGPSEAVSLTDYWRYDGLEFMVDGDGSGGDYTGSADPAWNVDEQRLNNNRSAQQFFGLADVPGGQYIGYTGGSAQWLVRPPFADGYGASTGTAPTTTAIEFCVTPFDNMIWNDSTASAPSPLFAGKSIGFQISVPDWDVPDRYHAFHTLSGQECTWRYADRFVDALLVGPSTGQMPPPRLRVNYPNGGEAFWGTTQQRIHWFADSTIANVRVEFSADDGAHWIDLAASTPNDGQFEWLLPRLPVAQARVRVSDAATGEPSDASDGSFTIREGLTADFDNSATVDLADYTLFAGQFGAGGDPGPWQAYDLDRNGSVGSGDFLIFMDNLGRSADQVVIADPPGPQWWTAGGQSGATVRLAGDVRLGSQNGVGPVQAVDIALTGSGLNGILQYEVTVEVNPAAAMAPMAGGAGFSPPAAFICPGVETVAPGVLRLAVAAAGGSGLSGSAPLGTLHLVTSPTFQLSDTAQVRITRVALGTQSTVLDVFADTLTVTLNDRWSAGLGITSGLGDWAVLHFGQRSDASDGMDPALGEEELPPWPPSDAFDARWTIVGTQGTTDDLRPANQTQVIWLLQVQPGDGGWPLLVTWNPAEFPPALSLRLADQDTWGQQFNLDMRAQASCTLQPGHPTRLAVIMSADVPVSCALDLPARWSMVSLPCVTADNSVAALFPQARSVWDYDGSYQLATALAPGVGYWINEPSPARISVQGSRYPYGTLHRALPAGWTMVGPGEMPLSAADLRSRYPSLVSVFGYAGGYRVVEAMAPGQGYWVHLAAPTTLDLSGWGGVARPAAAPQPAWAGPRLWVEAAGASQALDLGVAPSDVVALPPVPPAGLFDARVDIAPDIQAWQVPPGGTYRLRLQGEDLRLRWTLPEATDWQLEVDGVATPLQGRGELTPQPGAQVWLRSSSHLPLTTQLYSCYPNPFNPTTTIRYDLAEAASVRLRIFAVTGQLVRDLSPGDQPAGTYQLPWDGRDADGDPVGNGLYLVQLQAGQYQDVTRVAMMK